jgi:hypothetical protein
MQAVAAPMGLQQHGEGGILGDSDGPDRIHHHGDFEVSAALHRCILWSSDGSRQVRESVRIATQSIEET